MKEAYFFPTDVIIQDRKPVHQWGSEKIQIGETFTITINFHSSGDTRKISNNRISKKLLKTIVKKKNNEKD
jgi:hypothetical protein